MTFTQVTPRLTKHFSGLVIGFGPKGRSGRMCDSEVILTSEETSQLYSTYCLGSTVVKRGN